MRISDWSSDVCSSDLLIEILADALGADVELHVDLGCGLPLIDGGRARIFERQILHILRDEPDRRTVVLAVAQRFGEIGRASCRERVCQYVSISVVAVSLKKKK